jgi:hypothetical protein
MCSAAIQVLDEPKGVPRLSLILCLRLNMTESTIYAQQNEVEERRDRGKVGSAAEDSQRID